MFVREPPDQGSKPNRATAVGEKFQAMTLTDHPSKPISCVFINNRSRGERFPERFSSNKLRSIQALIPLGVVLDGGINGTVAQDVACQALIRPLEFIASP